MHHQIGAAGHVGPHLPAGGGIAVAQFGAQPLATDEGRIADDEIRHRPFGAARPDIDIGFAPRAFVRHGRAGDRMRFAGDAVPQRDEPALRIARQFAAIIGEQRILMADRAIGIQDGFGNVARIDRAELPFQEADPQHQIRDRHRARIEFQPEELARADRFTVEQQFRFAFAQRIERIEHLAFEPLHQFQADIEEVAGAAGRIEHAHGAQPVVIIAHRLQRAGGIAPPAQILDRGLHLLPIGAQRLHDRGDHQAFDIGARRIMRAQLRAFRRIERAFQQRAEDGGFDIGPAAAGGIVQFDDIVLIQRQRARIAEQAAVEPLDRGIEVGGVAAGIHDAPQAFQRGREMGGGGDHLVQQFFEAAVRDQPFGLVRRPHILREHREQAAHQELGDIDRRIFPFQPPGDDRQPGRDIARDFGRAAGGIERLRIRPDRGQPRLHVGQQQIVHRQAIPLPIGEMIVILPQPGEIGIDLDDVADIDDQQERRIAVIDGQGAGIILRLAPRGDHHLVPPLGAAAGVALLQRGFQPGQRQLIGFDRLPALGGLLGLQDEAAALVAIDAPGRTRPVRMAEGDVAFEHIVVEPRFLAREGGLGQPERAGEPFDEQLVIGQFRSARRLRIGDERCETRGIDGRHHGRVLIAGRGAG